MRILVVGCGSIGTRHIRNLLAMGYKDLVVYDVDEKVRQAVAARYRISACNSVRRELDRTNMAMICTPANTHVPLALLGLSKRNAVFIEKPLSTTLAGVDRLKKMARGKVMIGFNVRYHPMVLALKRLVGTMGQIYSAHMEYAYYLPGARARPYASGYAAKKAQGGGVILDHLHEIDYAIALFGAVRSVFASAQKVSKLNIQTEDTADIVLRFKAGFTCSVHLDYLQRTYSRAIKIVAEHGVVEGNFATGILSVKRYDKKAMTRRFPKDFDDTYKQELRHFINSLNKGKKPDIGVEEALPSLKVALAAKKSVLMRKVISL